MSSPVGAQLQCTFLSGFNGSACCTVQYGTDPTYMNLPYSAESTETGTAGNSVSVVLRERLNSSTVYYYTVSAVSGDVSVTVRGTFTTPQYSKYYHVIENFNPLNTEFFSLEISFSLNMPLTHHISICVKALTPKLSPTPLPALASRHVTLTTPPH